MDEREATSLGETIHPNPIFEEESALITFKSFYMGSQEGIS
jgi:hypothetical protein